MSDTTSTLAPPLPDELFPSDLSRWTTIQNTHPGENTIGWALGVMRFSADGRPTPEASKADIGIDGLMVFEGQTVSLQARFRWDDQVVTAPHSTTLLDLEDTDELLIDGNGLGAGLRVWLNSQGFLGLDRGELVPTADDSGRLPGLSSSTPMPTGEWVTIEAIIKLGHGVPDSVVGPIDNGFDANTTAAWCEIWLSADTGAPVMVMRQQGTTFFDRDRDLPVLEALVPGSTVSWPVALSFDSFQAGLSNNRSEVDQVLEMDDVVICRSP